MSKTRGVVFLALTAALLPLLGTPARPDTPAAEAGSETRLAGGTAVLCGKGRTLQRYSPDPALARRLWEAPGTRRVRQPPRPPDWQFLLWHGAEQRVVEGWARPEVVRHTVGRRTLCSPLPGLRRLVARIPAAAPGGAVPSSRLTRERSVAATSASPPEPMLAYPQFAGLSGRFIHGQVRGLLARGIDEEQGPHRGKEVALYLVEVYEEFTSYTSTPPANPPLPRFARVRWYPRYERLPEGGAQLLVGLRYYFWTTVERGRVIPHVTGQWALMGALAHSPLRIVQGTTVPWERELESHDYASPFSRENS